MSSKVLLLATAQVVLFGVVGRIVVDLLLGWIVRRDDLVRRIGTPERWLLASFGFTLWAVFLMLIHIATRGALFSSPWAVPVATLFLIGAWIRRGPATRWLPQRTAVIAVMGFAVVLLGLYASPALGGGSSLRTGDPPWHLGWTEQILAGEPLPVGPAPQFAANAYPWGLHAVFATLVRSVPASDPLIAHEALHLILIASIPLAAACLARLVNRRAGWTAALAASLIGGFGWIEAGTPDFVASPLDARYGADLVVASPNSLYELLPPALPRELGLVLLACAAILMAAALSQRGLLPSLLAGIAIGAVGLVSVPMLLSAVVWLVVAVVVQRVRDRRVGVMVGAAIATFALWAAPVAVDYVRYAGFVDVSPRLGVEWPLGTALASWGLLLPLAIGGMVVLMTQPGVVARDLTAFCIAAVGLVALALARSAFDWHLLGNETLLHQGRFWPPAHLLGSALTGIALVTVYGWGRRTGSAVVGVVLLVGAISPVFASVDLTRTIRERKNGFLYGSRDLQDGSFVRTAAERLDPDDVIRAEDDDALLAFYLFQFSGARIALDPQTDPAGNLWRIRFAELVERWREYESTGDFAVDYVVTKRGPDPDPLVSGEFRGEHWEMLPSGD